MIVPGEDLLHVSDFVDQFGGDSGREDVLVLVARLDGDGVCVVGFEGFVVVVAVAVAVAGGRGVVFAEGAAGGAGGAVEGDVRKEDGGEVFVGSEDGGGGSW